MAFRRKRQVAEETQPVDVASWPRDPTISLVDEHGPVKHVHFDGGSALAAPSSFAEAPLAEAVPPTPAVTEPEPVVQKTRRFGRRKKLYETDRGNKVLRVDDGGEQHLVLTGPEGEHDFVPESDVDPLIGGVTLAESSENLAPSEPVAPSLQVAALEHTYRHVVPASAPPTPQPRAAPADAWEPGTLHERRERARPERPAPVARRVRKARRKVARKVRKAKKRAPRRPYKDYPGDDHLVIDIEGIGPKFAKRLQKQGVYTTSRLAYESPGNLAKRIKAPRKVVKKWAAMSELIKAKGIGKQYAEVLVRAGVKGIDDLKGRKPKKLAKVVNKFLASKDVTIVGTAIHEGRANQWIKAAKRMKRRTLPVPHKGPPKTETVHGFIQKLPKYGAKKATKTKRTKRAKTARRPASRKAKGRKKR